MPFAWTRQGCTAPCLLVHETAQSKVSRSTHERNTAGASTYTFFASSKMRSTSAVFFLVASSSCNDHATVSNSGHNGRALTHAPETHLLALRARFVLPDNLVVLVPLDLLLPVDPHLPNSDARLLAQGLRVAHELLPLVPVGARDGDPDRRRAGGLRSQVERRGVDGGRDGLDTLWCDSARWSGETDRDEVSAARGRQTHGFLVARHEQVLAVLDRDRRKLVQGSLAFGRLDAHVVQEG